MQKKTPANEYTAIVYSWTAARKMLCIVKPDIKKAQKLVVIEINFLQRNSLDFVEQDWNRCRKG